MSDLSLEVCKILGLSSKEAEKIHIAAHLHDIGKVGVPDIVLNKEGKLTDEEWECMKRHPQIGAEILSKSHHLNELKDMVLYHHERVDGKGYPEGLFGNEIPFGAKIIAVCDSIDAMLSDRSYRKAHSYDFCYNEIEKNLGVMYDFEIGRMVLEQWDIVSHLYEKYRKKEHLKDIILLQRKN
ncbi:Cyclic di-GMP phosphodiesterase response regulator RpfG [anaerobic digester metagenome]